MSRSSSLGGGKSRLNASGRLGKGQPSGDPYRHEQDVAKRLRGRTTVASGAIHGDYDVKATHLMIDAKLTEANSFRVDIDEFEKIEKAAQKAGLGDNAAYAIGFKERDRTLIVIDMEKYAQLLDHVEELEKRLEDQDDS